MAQELRRILMIRYDPAHGSEGETVANALIEKLTNLLPAHYSSNGSLNRGSLVGQVLESIKVMDWSPANNLPKRVALAVRINPKDPKHSYYWTQAINGLDTIIMNIEAGLSRDPLPAWVKPWLADLRK
jgi:hypothetical protein